MTAAEAEFIPACDVCGVPWALREVTIRSSSREPLEIRCRFCSSLIEAGMLRSETVDGQTRWRHWHQEWKPGRLVGE